MGQHDMYYTDLEMLFLLNYKVVNVKCMHVLWNYNAIAIWNAYVSKYFYKV